MPEIRGVTGQTRLSNAHGTVARLSAYLMDKMSVSKQRAFVKTAPTMNLALRRETISEVGGFGESVGSVKVTFVFSGKHRCNSYSYYRARKRQFVIRENL